MRYEDDEFADEERVVVRTESGQATFLPVSARRLSGDALESYADLMKTGFAIAKLEAEAVQLVEEARELGVSWALIGSAIGLTSEGARQRYGVSDG